MSVVLNEFRESIMLLQLPHDGVCGHICVNSIEVEVFQESGFFVFPRQKSFFLQMLEDLKIEMLFASKLTTFSRLVLVKAGSACAHTFVCFDALGSRPFGIFRGVFRPADLLEGLRRPSGRGLAG